MRLFAKSPREMRREAENHRPGKAPTAFVEPAGAADPEDRPRLAIESDATAALDAAADWLAYLRTGQIQVR